MTKNPLTWFSTRATRQDQPIPATDQVRNGAGGHAWAVDDWTRLRRFLILGVDGPSYYASERQLVKENADAVLRCIAADGPRTVDEIVGISVAGRNPKQQPVVFALAACAAADDPDTRARALAALPTVCRTGTQLFLFAGYVEQFRGWGRGLRRAVASWYLDKDPDALAYQLVKYQQRDGWSHRDLLRLAKPRPERGGATDLALAWAVGKVGYDLDEAPALLRAHRAASLATSPEQTAALVTSTGLPWEALPSEHLRSDVVWRALIPDMGLGALVRNLARLTSNGTLAPGQEATETVVHRLTDAEQLRRARLHPIAVLAALMTYRAGRGTRGRQPWEPVTAIVDALDEAFRLSFGNIEPAGKRTLLALDVSGSMGMGVVAGVVGLTPRIASAAMSMVTLASEPSVDTVAFTSVGRGAWVSPQGTWRFGNTKDGLVPLTLSKRQRLDDVVRTVSDLPFGGTDCALPMLYALDKGRAIDHFVIYTDSETWAGGIHPSQALRRYRERTGLPARLTVVAMVSNGFTIADPNDAGMLDVVGFDTAAPQLMADFAAGRL
ncbi:MAG: TROVE domain-containing protein [Actinobacteria bacterium]|nr:TROVE domain-containing protein [Actinomycetota bacterium]